MKGERFRKENVKRRKRRKIKGRGKQGREEERRGK